jgi:hypothetical protein
MGLGLDPSSRTVRLTPTRDPEAKVGFFGSFDLWPYGAGVAGGLMVANACVWLEMNAMRRARIALVDSLPLRRDDQGRSTWP